MHPATPAGRRRLNYTTHFSLGGMWGTAYGIAAAQGLRGQKAVNTVFAVVYTGDVLLNTALGLYQPSTWTAKDWAIDVVDKYVQAPGHRRRLRPRSGLGPPVLSVPPEPALTCVD